MFSSTTNTGTAGGGLFGANPSTGGGLFGSTPQQQQPLGGTGGFGTLGTPSTGETGGLFGSSTGTGLFGASSTTQPGSGIGGGLFGAAARPNTTPVGGGFGTNVQQQQPQGTSLFGAPAASSQTGGLFGSATPSALGTGFFGSTGINSSGTGGVFGNTTQQRTTTGGGLFGSSTGVSTGVSSGPTNLFGNSTFGSKSDAASQPTGTKNIRWREEMSRDGLGRVQSITFLPEVGQKKSIEELRWEDYVLNLGITKMTNPSGATASPFGTGGVSTSTPFGSTAQAPSGGGLFGGTGLFGGQQQQPGGAGSTTGGSDLFGNNTNVFSGGTGASNQLGGAAKPGGLFGSTATGGGGLFGSTTTPTGTVGTSGLLGGTGNATSFGSTTGGGLFGNQQGTAGQGSQPGGLFGSRLSTTPGSSSAGGGIFGAPGTGTNLLQGNTGTTSTGLFGAQTTSTTPGTQPGGLFGSTPGTTGGGLFGTNTTGISAPAGPTGGLFRSTGGGATGTSTTPSLFGQAGQGTPGVQPGLGGGGIFGSTPAAPTGSTSGLLFGGTDNKAGASSGLFGTPQASGQTGFLGGSTLGAPASNTTGGLFGLGGGGTSGSLFGNAQTPTTTAQSASTTPTLGGGGSLFGQTNSLSSASKPAGTGSSSLFGGAGNLGTNTLTGLGTGGGTGGWFGTSTTPGSTTSGTLATSLGQTALGARGTTLGNGTGLFSSLGSDSSGALGAGAGTSLFSGGGISSQPGAFGIGGASGIAGLQQQQLQNGGALLSGVQPLAGSNAIPFSVNDPYGLARLSAAVYTGGIAGLPGTFVVDGVPSVVTNPFSFPASGVILPTQYRRYKSAALAQVWRPFPEQTAQGRRQLLPSLTPKRVPRQRRSSAGGNGSVAGAPTAGSASPLVPSGLGADYGWHGDAGGTYLGGHVFYPTALLPPCTARQSAAGGLGKRQSLAPRPVAWSIFRHASLPKDASHSDDDGYNTEETRKPGPLARRSGGVSSSGSVTVRGVSVVPPLEAYPEGDWAAGVSGGAGVTGGRNLYLDEAEEVVHAPYYSHGASTWRDAASPATLRRTGYTGEVDAVGGLSTPRPQGRPSCAAVSADTADLDWDDQLPPPWLSRSVVRRQRRARQSLNSSAIYEAGTNASGPIVPPLRGWATHLRGAQSRFGGELLPPGCAPQLLLSEEAMALRTGRLGLQDDGLGHTAGLTRRRRAELLAPICTREGYYLKPSIETLQSYSESRLAAVEDFTVVREGYGEITWPGLTDVRGLCIDDIVVIEDKAVEVYPELEDGPPSDTPPVGTGLNKPALITLYNCAPKPSRASHGSGDEENEETGNVEDRTKAEYEQHVNRMRCFTQKIGGQFISLTPQWVWKFRVEHFSRYAFEDEEDGSEAPDATATSKPSCASAPSPSAAEKNPGSTRTTKHADGRLLSSADKDTVALPSLTKTSAHAAVPLDPARSGNGQETRRRLALFTATGKEVKTAAGREGIQDRDVLQRHFKKTLPICQDNITEKPTSQTLKQPVLPLETLLGEFYERFLKRTEPRASVRGISATDKAAQDEDYNGCGAYKAGNLFRANNTELALDCCPRVCFHDTVLLQSSAHAVAGDTPPSVLGGTVPVTMAYMLEAAPLGNLTTKGQNTSLPLFLNETLMEVYSILGLDWNRAVSLTSAIGQKLLTVQLQLSAKYYALALEQEDSETALERRIFQYHEATWKLFALLFGPHLTQESCFAPLPDVQEPIIFPDNKIEHHGNQQLLSSASPGTPTAAKRKFLENSSVQNWESAIENRVPLSQEEALWITDCTEARYTLEALSEWFAEQNSRRIQPDLERLSKRVVSSINEAAAERGVTHSSDAFLTASAMARLERAFLYLTAKDIDSAVAELLGVDNVGGALEDSVHVSSQPTGRVTNHGSGSFIRLALCLSGSGSPSPHGAPLNREPHFRQLLEWQRRGTYDKIPVPILRIHHIVAGCIDRLVASKAIDWRSLFALLLWFPSPDATLYLNNTSETSSDSSPNFIESQIHCLEVPPSSMDDRQDAPRIVPSRALQRALQLYLNNLVQIPNQTVTPAPLPCFIDTSTSDNQDPEASMIQRRPLKPTDTADLQFNLIRLFAHQLPDNERSTFLELDSVPWNAAQPSFRDATLLWGMFKMLRPHFEKELKKPTDASATCWVTRVDQYLDDHLCRQLEAYGLWHNCVVLHLSHVKCGYITEICALRQIRETLVRNCALRDGRPLIHVGAPRTTSVSYAEQLHFVLDVVKLPMLFVSYAQALWFEGAHRRRCAADQWLDCAMYAHEWATTSGNVSNSAGPDEAVSDAAPAIPTMFDDVIHTHPSLLLPAVFMTPTSFFCRAVLQLLHSSAFLCGIERLCALFMGNANLLWCALVLPVPLYDQIEQELFSLNVVRSEENETSSDDHDLESGKASGSQTPPPVPEEEEDLSRDKAVFEKKNAHDGLQTDKPRGALENLPSSTGAVQALGDCIHTEAATILEELEKVLEDEVSSRRLGFSGSKLLRRPVVHLCEELTQRATTWTLITEWKRSPAEPLTGFVVWLYRLLEFRRAVAKLTDTLVGDSCGANHTRVSRDTEKSCNRLSTKLSTVPRADLQSCYEELTYLRSTASQLYVTIQSQVDALASTQKNNGQGEKEPFHLNSSEGQGGASYYTGFRNNTFSAPGHQRRAKGVPIFSSDNLQRTSRLPNALTDLQHLPSQVVACLVHIQKVISAIMRTSLARQTLGSEVTASFWRNFPTATSLFHRPVVHSDPIAPQRRQESENLLLQDHQKDYMGFYTALGQMPNEVAARE